eukprot:10013650-Heterocapsa_arctica.AAC.1
MPDDDGTDEVEADRQARCGKEPGRPRANSYRASGPPRWRRWKPKCQSTVACQVRVHCGGCSRLERGPGHVYACGASRR